MSHEAVPIRCSILRGGTSRGVFFLENDLPAERADIEPILLDVFGSPDDQRFGLLKLIPWRIQLDDIPPGDLRIWMPHSR